ncbi:hypothetical protein K493DRAFT_311875 [Basidiobolus meristosporus CBS 931.73]|uniref:Uncharacterized protein n=1 Tax=Basidiobolus meristosporus CBS 931.73 TaxID=1314790 RepID=A0A1Y1YZ73_9FUNG|nr:hypothetical protein K493DRAFT_311875 [Basidiobolus meristosporus CBS 931.73]|eukprot:ORY02987.1 hypothetical protein K493DRAFT_311875 [Basidiobolus meristosporus CBS 931.73]
MFLGSTGTLEAFRRSFLMGIAEVPSLFQRQRFLASRFAWKKSSNLVQLLTARFLLMDKPYWREDQLRNWHISEHSGHLKRDSALEPYSLIHQRFFEDIVNDRTVVSIAPEDVKLPSPYNIYFLSTPTPCPQSNISPKSLRLTSVESDSVVNQKTDQSDSQQAVSIAINS